MSSESSAAAATAAAPTSTPSTSTSEEVMETTEEPTVVWSSKGPTTQVKSFANAVQQQSRSSSRASKRSNKDGNGPPKKKKRVFYDFKINIWNRQLEGDLRDPISLADWRIMNTQLCTAAASKVRSCGPPNGGVGQKHWQEHSDGTKKTSELPDTQRFGHTVIRFSTLEAQEWYQPLVDSVLGIAQDGRAIKLTTEVEQDDDRARYVFSLPAVDFHAFGKTKEEREVLLKDLILAALDPEIINIGVTTMIEPKDCQVYSSFLHQERNKEDMWKIGMKFPTLLETKLDAILQGEKFGILPSAITGLRVLKKQSSGTREGHISRALKKTNLGPPSRSGSTDSVKRARSSSSGRGKAAKKVADGPTPDKN